jgi:cytochrome c-type biogenesis protein CcmE
VLAKHDENYMPPEAAEALEKAGRRPEYGKSVQAHARHSARAGSPA